MPRYRVGDQGFHRKHAWLPCVIGDRFEDMTDEEKVAAFKATRWAENITNAEWPALLGYPEGTAANKSRLKRKAVGWYMALGRIAALNPALFDRIVQEARALYAEQLGEPHPTLGQPER
jgi:hypothetical protein